MNGKTLVLAFVAVLAGVAYLVIRWAAEPTAQSPGALPRVMREACQEALGDYLISPRSARVVEFKGPTALNGSWVATVDVDSQNALGVWVRSHWWCEYRDGRVLEVTQM